ncbi:isochorismatase family protein [Streptacidiphilus jiangxiensis]|uniref:Nicotinamidase-related amidase n=1 Tax=Streptacidiphilus jiangxiensis TaxID=235985 RepID=A0A1H7F5U5_STRJI|nr:isochorismatase family protein [Streptacidiphilus jiangxiensis]SEK21503.1 Nicotinamidase-related amidase [Streptacidiphilus jiangxiensis]
MAVGLRRLLDPAHTAVVTCECQEAVLGEKAVFPALAEAAQQAGLVGNVRRLCAAARDVDVPVVHCTAERRADGLGGNTNARLFAAAARAATPFDPALHPGLGADPERDFVLPRLHGLGPFQDTGLASLLRNLGATTLVVTGVSLNVALLELTLGAVDAGLQVVIPTDAVAGTPPAYAEAVLTHTLALVATLATTDDVVAVLTTPGRDL